MKTLIARCSVFALAGAFLVFQFNAGVPNHIDSPNLFTLSQAVAQDNGAAMNPSTFSVTGEEDDFAPSLPGEHLLSPGVQAAWARRYASHFVSGQDEANAITVDATGNIYVTGGGANHSGLMCFTTIKYAANGIQQWGARYNGSLNRHEYLNALALDNSGNIYVTGFIRVIMRR